MKPLLLTLMLILWSCGGTTTGNPVDKSNVTIRMQDQQPFALLRNISEGIIPSAKAAVSNVKFCFKRLRFKAEVSDSTGKEIEFNIGEVEIDPNGFNLATVSVANGTYNRVEFDLEKDCEGATNPSVTTSNDNGTFTTDDRMTIKFEGSYTVSADGTLNLNVDALFDALETVNNGNQIKNVLESATGDY